MPRSSGTQTRTFNYVDPATKPTRRIPKERDESGGRHGELHLPEQPAGVEATDAKGQRFSQTLMTV